MTFYFIRFAVVVAIWLIFADKRRWRELFPVSFFAGFLGASTDIVMPHYPLWIYDGNISSLPNLANDWELYLVTTYLFIQWLPSRRTWLRLLGYWFAWTAVAAGIEVIHLKTGHLVYHQWWTAWHSYLADWVLFWIFYQYHRLFRFYKLSE